MSTTNQFEADEGTVTFWVENETLQSDDRIALVSLNDEDGGINISAKEGYVYIKYVYKNKGGWNMRYNVEKQDDEEHMIAVTWSRDDGVDLYIDGEMVMSNESEV